MIFFEFNRPIDSNSDYTATLLHQNIAGLLNKTDSVQLCLNELLVNNVNVDILCFSETFVRAGDELNIHLKNFNFACSFSRKSEKRGGVCILVNKMFDFKHIELPKGLCIEKIFECCGVEIPSLKCIVICIYRIPNTKTSSFFEKLDLLLHKLLKRKKRVIVTGDLNIDTLKETNDSIQLKDIISNYGLRLYIDKPTRQHSCLDQIISNIDNSTGTTHEVFLSDHNTCQTLTFPVEQRKPALKYWYKVNRDYSDENIKKIVEAIANLSWIDVFENTDANESFNIFHENFLLFYKLCFPIRKSKVYVNSTSPKWITKGIRKSSTYKRQLKKMCYLNNKNNEIRSRFLKYNKVLKGCVLRSKKCSNLNYMMKSKNKNKASWDIIKNRTDSHKTFSQINAIDHDGKILNDPNQIANSLNNYFIDISNTKTQSAINTSSSKPTRNSSSIFLNPCSETEVFQVITSLNNKKSVGYDEISTHILKLSAKVVSPILCHTINLSLFEGIFPDKLKFSVVKPLHKSKSTLDKNNYRPITLVPIISKMYEKIMQNRLIQFINKHNIINEEQNGFQKGKSTTLAAFSLVKSVTDNIDKKRSVSVIFLDMSKAFDLVNHNTLLDKCERYGIRGPALEWLKSYLSDRQQCVEVSRINDKLVAMSYRSVYRRNESGVPQGSILGPLLFLLYINDLPNITKHKCVLFADDVSIVIPDNNKTLHQQEVNQTINDTIHWLNENNLKINLSKTKYIQFSNYKQSPTLINLKHNNEVISKESSIKFLGLTLDENCNWGIHIDNLCRKLNRFVYALRELRKTSNEEAALNAYHGYVAAVLRYGLLLWGNSAQIQRAFIVQKKCLRAITGAPPHESCKPIFKKFNVLTLVSMYILEIGLFVRRNSKFFIKVTDDNRFIKRDPTKLKNQFCKSSLHYRNSYQMSIKIYNHIPKNIRELPFRFFKSNLKNWLLEKNFYSVQEFIEDSVNKHRY